MYSKFAEFKEKNLTVFYYSLIQVWFRIHYWNNCPFYPPSSIYQSKIIENINIKGFYKRKNLKMIRLMPYNFKKMPEPDQKIRETGIPYPPRY